MTWRAARTVADTAGWIVIETEIRPLRNSGASPGSLRNGGMKTATASENSSFSPNGVSRTTATITASCGNW
ncbi:MAG: hypothetical protein ACETVW_06265, partial [Dehalococcoidia bacterium]